MGTYMIYQLSVVEQFKVVKNSQLKFYYFDKTENIYNKLL